MVGCTIIPQTVGDVTVTGIFGSDSTQYIGDVDKLVSIRLEYIGDEQKEKIAATYVTSSRQPFASREPYRASDKSFLTRPGCSVHSGQGFPIHVTSSV